MGNGVDDQLCWRTPKWLGVPEGTTMRQIAAVLCLLIVAVACGGGDTLPGGPSPIPSGGAPPDAVPAPPAIRVISVGEEVKGRVDSSVPRLFDVIAPKDGTLAVRLAWEAAQPTLRLDVADSRFIPLAPDGSSPIDGRLSVAAGRTYRIRVSLDLSPWDYGSEDQRFVLTTWIE
jgi:hypothetical protein